MKGKKDKRSYEKLFILIYVRCLLLTLFLLLFSLFFNFHLNYIVPFSLGSIFPWIIIGIKIYYDVVIKSLFEVFTDWKNRKELDKIVLKLQQLSGNDKSKEIEELMRMAQNIQIERLRD